MCSRRSILEFNIDYLSSSFFFQLLQEIQSNKMTSNAIKYVIIILKEKISLNRKWAAEIFEKGQNVFVLHNYQPAFSNDWTSMGLDTSINQ